MSTVAIALLLVAAGVLLNGLFAGYETGFVSADRIRVRYMAEEDNDTRARTLLSHMTNPERMITTVLVGTNAALIVGTMALSSQIPNEFLATLVAAPLFCVFAEIIPKTIFRRHPNRLSLVLLPVIRVFDILLAPLVLPAVWGSRALRAIMRTGDFNSPGLMSTQEDFRNLVDESAAHGSIEREEQEMIHSVMDLQSIPAKTVMVPRIDVQGLPDDATRDDLIALFASTGRTRIPIYAETIDSIIGIANAYDVLLDSTPEDQNIKRFVHDVPHVPDTKPVGELMQELKNAHQHLAVVTDEHGGTDGIITLEDILEEIFGEIRDEHDIEQDLIVRAGPHAYLVEARMSLEDLSTAIGVTIEDDNVETVGGWVMHVAGCVPPQGEKIRHDEFRITVLEGSQSHITRVRIDVLPQAGAPTNS